MRSRRMAALAAALVAAAALSAAAAEETDLWFEVTLGEAPMGYTHEFVTVGDDGQVTTTVQSDFTMRRGEDLVSVKGTDEWVESADGRPLSYRQTRKMAAATLELNATVGADGLRLRKSDGTDAIFSTVRYDGRLFFPHALEALHAQKAVSPGATYSYVAFDPDFERASTFNVRVEGVEQLELLGETRKLTKLAITSDLYEGVTFYEWRDRSGELWREEVPSLAMGRVRTTSDVALRERKAADILAVSAIESNVNILDPARVDEALYEITVEGGDAAGLVPEDLRQTIEKRTDGGIVLRVKRTVPEPGTTIHFPVRSTPLKDYLEGNPLMQTWYPRLLGSAAKAVWGSESDSWRGAAQIESWVYEHVEDKGMGTAFASAREVLEQMSGDCSEHAVLMAAMARAVAIPAKLVSGVVHHDGEFAYHMWVEVWTGDGWYALDPTVGEGSVDATHIKLSESSLPGGRVAELSLGLMKVFNRLNIRVLEYTVNGETVTVPG